MDSAEFIGLEGGRGYVGEAFACVDVALERCKTGDLIRVRYANVRLGQLDTSAKPRLLPDFSDKGWETKPIKPTAIRWRGLPLPAASWGPAPKPPEFCALGQWGRMPCHPGRVGKVALALRP